MTATKNKKKSAVSGKKTTAPIGSRPVRDRKIVIVHRTGTYGMLGYRAATLAASEGRIYTAASGERHTRYHRTKLITQSREFMRNNAIYKGMIKKAISYIVGNGFTLQMKTDDDDFNTKAEKLWDNWHRWPEVRHVLSGRKTDRMICRELLVAGDTLVILVNGGSIQLIEAEQIASRSGRPADGISKNKFGRPTKFWICPYKGGQVNTGKAAEYRPENVLFITDPERASAIRGVPPCQSAFPMLHRINDVCDSEAIAWQLLARMAVSINRKEGAQQGFNESKADPNKTSSDTEGDLTTRLTELDYALMFHAEPGEEIKGIDRNIPGKNFSESLRMFLRLLGLPLGLPLEIILLDWTKSNYSQSRAVLEQAYTTFLDYQFALEDYYYRPLLEWKLQQWINAKKLKDNEKKFEFDLIKPTFPWIDQLKEAKAYGEKVDRGFTTHSQVCKAQNAERDDIVKQREKEVKDAIERAKRIKKDAGVDVPWQMFCGLGPPKAASPTGADKEGGQEKTSEEEED